MSVELKQPVQAYTAQNNSEGQLLVIRLTDKGIPAVCIEDHSGVGETAFGVSTLHRPKIMVESDQLTEAQQLIADYEEALRETKELKSQADKTWKMIDAVCEDCGTVTQFAEELKGSVELCSKCGEYVDVGEVEWDEADFSGDDESESQESSED